MAVVTSSAVWEVIERRKREKAEIEEEVGRKEAAAIGEAMEVTHKIRSREIGRERANSRRVQSLLGLNGMPGRSVKNEHTYSCSR